MLVDGEAETKPAFRSNLELSFANLMTQSGVLWLYEPLRFALNYGNVVTYTPDFMLIGKVLTMVEIKPSWKAKGASSTRKSLKIAAGRFPWFLWVGATKSGGRWTFEPFSESLPEELQALDLVRGK